MKNFLFFLSTFSVITIYSCKTSEKNNEQFNLLSELKNPQISQSVNNFGLNIFKQLDSLQPNSNLFISPFSIFQALSMTLNGANGITKEEMIKVLGLTDYSLQQLNEFNQSLINGLSISNSQVIFEIANSIWYRQEFNVLHEFIELNKRFYFAEVNKCNFTDPSTVDLINNWCKEKTNNNISKILDQISDDAFMYLINAIYFNGKWKFSFDESKTKETEFFLEDNSVVLHKQMIVEATLKYYSCDEFSIVELPYSDSSYNMTLILPENNLKVSDLIKTLDIKKYLKARGNMSYNKVVVKMPRFKIEFNSLLNKPLINMGMSTAFDKNNADFSNIREEKNIFISKLIHKTFIENQEKGTEASAVTAVEISLTSVNPDTKENIKWFIADRPFIFAITENSSGIVLFIGKISNPLNEKININ